MWWRRFDLLFTINRPTDLGRSMVDIGRKRAAEKPIELRCCGWVNGQIQRPAAS